MLKQPLDDGVWVLHDYMKGHKIGQVVAVPDGSPRLGDRALVNVLDSEGKNVIAMTARGGAFRAWGFLRGPHSCLS